MGSPRQCRYRQSDHPGDDGGALALVDGGRQADLTAGAVGQAVVVLAASRRGGTLLEDLDVEGAAGGGLGEGAVGDGVPLGNAGTDSQVALGDDGGALTLVDRGRQADLTAGAIGEAVVGLAIRSILRESLDQQATTGSRLTKFAGRNGVTFAAQEPKVRLPFWRMMERSHPLTLGGKQVWPQAPSTRR